MTQFGKRGLQQDARRAWDGVPPPAVAQAGIGETGDEEAEPGSAVLFGLVLVAAVVIGGAVGLYLFGKDKASGPAVTEAEHKPVDQAYTSPLDAKCSKGWTKDLPNGKQLQCYLTRSVQRLCDPRERKHLIEVMKRYQADTAVFDAAFVGASIEMIGKLQTQGYKLGFLSAKIEKEGNTQKSDGDWKELMSASESITSGPDDVMRLAKDLVPQYILINEVKALLLKGLISEEDFGFWGDPLVRKAIREIAKDQQKIKPICQASG